MVRIRKALLIFLRSASHTHHAKLFMFFLYQDLRITQNYLCVFLFQDLRITQNYLCVFLYKDLVEESEDDTRFDDISDSQPPIELPAAELARSGFTFNHIVPTRSHQYTKANNVLIFSKHPIDPSGLQLIPLSLVYGPYAKPSWGWVLTQAPTQAVLFPGILGVGSGFRREGRVVYTRTGSQVFRICLDSWIRASPKPKLWPISL